AVPLHLRGRARGPGRGAGVSSDPLLRMPAGRGSPGGVTPEVAASPQGPPRPAGARPASPSRTPARPVDPRGARGPPRRAAAARALCGAGEDLTNHHVVPLSYGRGLQPGNAVTLCRACNSSIHDSPPSHLPPVMASKLERAAARFKDLWEGGRRTTGPATEGS